METIKENGKRFFAWFGNGKKMLAGGMLFLAGLIVQSFSTKPLEQNAFLLMAAGLMCLVNALFSKISGKNINLFLYLLINIGIVEVGMALTSYNLIGTEDTDSLLMGGIWVAAVLLIWVLQAVILPAETKSRRLFLAFLETLLSALAALAAFVVPILLSIWI